MANGVGEAYKENIMATKTHNIAGISYKLSSQEVSCALEDYIRNKLKDRFWVTDWSYDEDHEIYARGITKGDL